MTGSDPTTEPRKHTLAGLGFVGLMSEQLPSGEFYVQVLAFTQRPFQPTQTDALGVSGA